MSHSKKSRKGGDNGPKLAPRTKKVDRKAATKKKNSGNRSGSRHNAALIKDQLDPNAEAKKNPRHGSKKPVALSLPETTAKPSNTEEKKAQKPQQTDEQKLLKLEEDPRLNKLLDMLEEGRQLSNEDQVWLDKQLNTIERLMTKLGIADEEDNSDTSTRKATDDELFAQFESGADLLKDYQE